MTGSGKPDLTRSSQSQSDLGELQKYWLELAQTFGRYGGTIQATMLSECAADLERTMKAVDERLLSLSEASVASGYSTDHLGRLIRENKIRNHGRRGKPLLREGDLPHRASRVDASPQARYDPGADARALRSRARKTA